MDLKTFLACGVCSVLLFLYYVQSADVVVDSTEESYNKHHNCDALKHNYTEAQKQFLECAITYSEPVTYCQHCIQHFIDQIRTYKNFTGNATCRSIYVDNDRLNIIQTTFASARNLWNAGSCSECFACNIEETPANCSASNSTLVFNDLMGKLDVCIIDFLRNKTLPCLGCIEKYNEVNYMYNQLKKNRGENICFDIKDAMNKTRIRWSKEFHCCEDRKSSKIYFFSLASAFSAISVIFYVSIFIWGKHNEHLQYESIDGESHANHDTSVSEPSTSATRDQIDNIEVYAHGEPSTNNDAESAHKNFADHGPSDAAQLFI